MSISTNAPETHNQCSDLTKLPWLASPLLKFDLFRELKALRGQNSWDRETGRSSKTLAKHSDFRLVLVLMKAHTRMSQRQAEGRISIHQLLGSACVHMPDQEVNLVPGELLVLDGNRLHNIESLEESAFLLTISWRENRENPKDIPEEGTLDDEALRRMDDEGGSNRTTAEA